MPGKFEVSEMPADRWQVRLKASNGAPLAHNGPFATKAAAKKGCESIQKAADGAIVVELHGVRTVDGSETKTLPEWMG